MDERPLPRFRYHPDPVATGAITQVEFDNAMSAPLGVTPVE